jgi:crossover junction endodeoxyribonuclease RuvC
MARVVGLDASLTGSGLVVLDDQTSKIIYVNTFRNKLDGTTRLAYLKTEICSVLQEYASKKYPVFIEGYGFSFRGCDFKLAELGGILRLAINENLGMEYQEIPPTTLKMFVTGKGNAPKNVMLEQVFRRFNIGSEVLKDDNQVDAYALAKFGIAFNFWKKYPNDYKGTKKEIESFKKVPEPCCLDKSKAYIL